MEQPTNQLLEINMINITKKLFRTLEKTLDRADSIIDKSGETLEKVVTTACNFVNVECDAITTDQQKERDALLAALPTPTAIPVPKTEPAKAG